MFRYHFRLKTFISPSSKPIIIIMIEWSPKNKHARLHMMSLSQDHSYWWLYDATARESFSNYDRVSAVSRSPLNQHGNLWFIELQLIKKSFSEWIVLFFSLIRFAIFLEKAIRHVRPNVLYTQIEDTVLCFTSKTQLYSNSRLKHFMQIALGCYASNKKKRFQWVNMQCTKITMGSHSVFKITQCLKIS